MWKPPRSELLPRSSALIRAAFLRSVSECSPPWLSGSSPLSALSPGSESSTTEDSRWRGGEIRFVKAKTLRIPGTRECFAYFGPRQRLRTLASCLVAPSSVLLARARARDRRRGGRGAAAGTPSARAPRPQHGHQSAVSRRGTSRHHIKSRGGAGDARVAGRYEKATPAARPSRYAPSGHPEQTRGAHVKVYTPHSSVPGHP